MQGLWGLHARVYSLVFGLAGTLKCIFIESRWSVIVGI